MDVFSQGFFLIALPLLLIVVAVLGILGLGSRQIKDTKELQDKINKLIENIRKALFIDKFNK